uniref:hypothetical protein n=1 Tax=Salmonella enterica TaxID=28901 RepID=UPI00329801ED
LYVTATIEGMEITKAMVDGGAGVNVMPLATFRNLGISEDRVVPNSIMITGIDEKPMPTLGYVVLDLVVGPLKMMGRFHITKPDTHF